MNNLFKRLFMGLLLTLAFSSCVEVQTEYSIAETKNAYAIPHQVFVDFQAYAGDTLIMVKHEGYQYYFNSSNLEKPQLVYKVWTDPNMTVVPKGVWILVLVLFLVSVIFHIIRD